MGATHRVRGEKIGMVEGMRPEDDIGYVVGEPLSMGSPYGGAGIIAFGVIAIFWLIAGFVLGALLV